MSIPGSKYVHTYSNKESARLLAQSEVLRKGVYNDKVIDILGKAKNVVEFGSGSGANIFFQLLTFRNIKQFTGLDIAMTQSEDKILSELEKVDRVYLDKLVLKQADVQQIPEEACPSASQDVVFGTLVLEHIFEPQKVIREALRLAKPGGKLIFLECSWKHTNLITEDPKLKKVAEQYDKHKKFLTDAQLAARGNPFYCDDAMEKDFRAVIGEEQTLEIRDIDYSPGGEFSQWDTTKEGKQGALGLICDLLSSPEGADLPGIDSLKDKLIKRLEKDPNSFTFNIVTKQVIVDK